MPVQMIKKKFFDPLEKYPSLIDLRDMCLTESITINSFYLITQRLYLT